MAIIQQTNIFSWKEISKLGDLKRLQLIINNFPDEKLMKLLEIKRKKGRNDYPIRPIWNSILAAIVYEHISIESLRRELLRNAQLREICGFNLFKGEKAIPPSSVYSNFLKTLIKHQKEIDNIFNTLVKELQKELPDFGKILAGDGKAIHSYGKESKKKKRDGRRDVDGNIGIKTYSGINKDGTLWKKVKSWFGYKLHLISDAKYELPIAFEVTKASKAEGKVMKNMFSKMDKSILEKCHYALFDRGYDGEKFIKELYDKYGIKPIIDIRNMWKDQDKTRVLLNTKNIVYDYKGTISCYCPIKGDMKEMTFKGFEEKRKSLKYICPAKAYGIQCMGYKKCLHTSGIRISLSYNRRIFTPVARSSFKWKNLYKKRTSIERINGRLDLSFGFERHFIRGLKKMNLRCSLALCVMLTLALGRIRKKRPDLMRSLVKSA